MNDREMIKTINDHTAYIKENNLPFEGFEIIQRNWYGRILLELCQRDSMRFGEIKKAMPGISNVVLTSALKGLVEKGLATREQFNEIPPHVEYVLTEKGRGMLPIFYELICWEKRFCTMEDEK